LRPAGRNFIFSWFGLDDGEKKKVGVVGVGVVREEHDRSESQSKYIKEGKKMDLFLKLSSYKEEG